MSRLARAEIFAHDEVAIVHVMNRVVRRCFLMGTDVVSGKNFDHRKRWVEDELQRLAAQFGIDLLGFAILSNHFHLLLRSRPDCVAQWDDSQVARRWWMLCPRRRHPDGSAAEPTQNEIDFICNDPVKLARYRERLSDISWWMRLLCQKIAQQANAEDGEIGKFWQSRYRAIKLLDETALLACSAYVDLNVVRAGIADALQASNHTSIQRRIEASLQADSADSSPDTEWANGQAAYGEALPQPAPSNTRIITSTADDFLAPLPLHEHIAPIGTHPSHTARRCSDKGFLAMSTEDYLALLEWTVCQRRDGRATSSGGMIPAVLARLSLSPEVWCPLVRNFGKLFHSVAGRPTVVEESRSRLRQRRYRVSNAARELLGEAA